MNPRVESVKVLPNYTLHLVFKNGEEKLFDVTPYLETGVFKALKNIALFATAKQEYGTVVWQNNIDIDPDTLYIDGVAVKDKAA